MVRYHITTPKKKFVIKCTNFELNEVIEGVSDSGDIFSIFHTEKFLALISYGAELTATSSSSNIYTGKYVKCIFGIIPICCLKATITVELLKGEED